MGDADRRRDWRSYDDIADRYDRAWGARFEIVARAMLERMSKPFARAHLDVGTGTGVVPGVFAAAGRAARTVVGCDRSAGMLHRARGKLPALRTVAAEACALPFTDRSFEIGTASFVLSHLRDPEQALVEVLRVLEPGGLFIASNWAPATDPAGALWGEALAQAITRREADRALAEVAPWETPLAQAGALAGAFARAGFTSVQESLADASVEITVEQFLEDRALSSGGRLGLSLLGAGKWARFLGEFGDRCRSSIGNAWRAERAALIVAGVKPMGLRLPSP